MTLKVRLNVFLYRWPMLAGSTPEELQAQADEFDWFHSIDLGRGVVTKGSSEFAWGPEQLPPVAGRTVLDIGAWDGGYSLMAERHGANRVVALDHYVWGLNWEARDTYWRECATAGVLPDHNLDATKFWQPELPGRRGFDFAKEALGSSVEPMVADFATMDLEKLGRFDVVFYLGVLYHMPEPLAALRRVRAVTKQVAAIETAAVHIPGRTHERLLEFEAGNELGGDFGNWYVPSLEALCALCRAAGFGRVEVVVGRPPEQPSSPPQAAPSLVERLRQALRPAPPSPPAPAPLTIHFRAMVHAFP
jgi:tRNA (mo5U34)-methyltransferase